MESDLSTALALSLKHNKPAGMDIVDYVTSIQSKILKKEEELFFKEFLCDSESNELYDQQVIQENVLPYSQSLENFKNNTLPENIVLLDRELASVITSDYNIEPNTCLIQPLITMKTLNETTKLPIINNIFGCNTNGLQIDNANQKFVDIMVQSVRKALDYLMYTLFDNTLLMETVINWDDCNNLVRYFSDLLNSMTQNIEFVFICRDNVTMFVQNTAFKILDDHHLYSSIHVEYQCNLLAEFCYDKYIRWNTINLLINRLKIDVHVVPNSSYLRSIFYIFHMIDKLLHNIDFCVTTATTDNKNNLTYLWKINHTNEIGNEIEIMKQILEEWTNSLEYISMEALRNNVFLLSLRANQCLVSMKSIKFE